MDELLMRSDALGTRVLLADVIGSTVALTDPAGAVKTQYSYEPFGAATASGESSLSVTAFTGREADGTGLYYYRARYYEPFIQRFISEDPSAFRGGDMNLYGYVGNHPTGFTDPTGLEKNPCKIPEAPPLANLDENIRLAIERGRYLDQLSAMTHTPNLSKFIWLYEMVAPGAPWDYKRYGTRYEDFGNFNFGAVGLAANFSADVLLRGAGAVHMSTALQNPWRPTWRPSFGWPGGGPPYGDDPRDQKVISDGMDFFRNCR
jgi:RHS repeat-associated protein